MENLELRCIVSVPSGMYAKATARVEVQTSTVSVNLAAIVVAVVSTVAVFIIIMPLR